MTSEGESESIITEINDALQAENQPSLTAAEYTVLKRLLQEVSLSYRQIASEGKYKEKSLRQAASKLFKKLAPLVAPHLQYQDSGRLNKRDTIAAVEAWYQQQTAGAGGQIPGREADLNRLVSEVNRRGRRLICISGPIGIGKTPFVQALGRQLEISQSGFERLIYCSASDFPSIETLYRYLAEREVSQTDAVLALTDLLRQHRLILILDKGDSLCDAGSPDGAFKPEAQLYERWLENLRDIPDLQSCVIWVGRVEPGCLQVHRNHLHHYRLPPLEPQPAHNLLRERFRNYRLNPSQQDIERLAAFCGYNPGVLNLAVGKICDEGNNSIERFLNHPLLVATSRDDDWRSFLTTVTPEEQSLLGWLLLYPDEKARPDEPIGADTDRSYENRQWTQSLLRAAQTLRRRGLLEIDADDCYFLQSPWLYHVVARHLVDRLLQQFESIAAQPEPQPQPELLLAAAQILAQHPLIAPQAPAWKRAWHQRHVLRPLIDRLPDRFWSKDAKQTLIDRILKQIHQASSQNPRWREGYAVGNLLNLAVELKIPLKNLSFAGAVIQYADLRFAQIHQANFSGCQLRQTLLPVLLQGSLTAALSPNGSTLAIGDSQGWVLCWQRDRDRWRFDRFTQIREQSTAANITRLAFADDRMLAIATDNNIYSWWFLSPDEQPQPIASISAAVTSLICSVDYTVAGLENGGTIVCSSMGNETTLLSQFHMNAVEALTFEPEGDRLASLGFGDQIFVWNLLDTQLEPETIQLRFRPEAIVWQEGHLLSVGLVDGRYQLSLSSKQTVNLPYAHTNVQGVAFSQNGAYLAVIERNAIAVWHTQNIQQTTRVSQIPVRDPLLIKTISSDGAWLLAISRDHQRVQLWETDSGQLHWEQRSQETSARAESAAAVATFTNCTGLTQTEKRYFQALGANCGDVD